MLCLERIEGGKSKGQIAKADTILPRSVSRENFLLARPDWLEPALCLMSTLLPMAAASVTSGSCQVSFIWIELNQNLPTAAGNRRRISCHPWLVSQEQLAKQIKPRLRRKLYTHERGGPQDREGHTHWRSWEEGEVSVGVTWGEVVHFFLNRI